MTAHSRDRRIARVLTLGAGGTAAAGLWSFPAHPWLTLAALYVAAVFAWCAVGHRAAHRRQVAEDGWWERRVLGECPAPLNPCCLLSHYSDGAVHDRHRCTDLFRHLAAHLTDEHRSSP